MHVRRQWAQERRAGTGRPASHPRQSTRFSAFREKVILLVIDALHDAQNEIKTVACRQEGGATNMAEAYGKLTGKPGVAMVTGDRRMQWLDRCSYGDAGFDADGHFHRSGRA